MKKIIIISIAIVTFLLITGISNVYGVNFELRIMGTDKIGVGEQLQFNAFYDMLNDMPEPGQKSEGIIGGADYTNKVTWKSSNKKVAKVNSNGIVTGVSEGKAIISVEYNGEEPAKMEVEVVKEKQGEEPTYEIPLYPNTVITPTYEIPEEPYNTESEIHNESSENNEFLSTYSPELDETNKENDLICEIESDFNTTPEVALETQELPEVINSKTNSIINSYIIVGILLFFYNSIIS